MIPEAVAKQDIEIYEGVAVFIPSAKEKATSPNDMYVAKPMPLPAIDGPGVMIEEEGKIESEPLGTPGFSSGSIGNGH